MANQHKLRAPAAEADAARDAGFGFWDLLFLVVLALALAGVVLAGRFAYREGMALETAKSNAQALVQWAEAVAATGAKDVPLTLALCGEMPGVVPEQAAMIAPEGPAGLLATGQAGEDQAAAAATATAAETAAPAQPAVAATWATCREALFTGGGPLSHLSNPFDRNNPVAGSACEKKNRAVRGVVFLQKGTPSPPGMPANVSWDALADDEPLVRGLMLRVRACDAGGYPIHIAEVKL